jgi:hypothetical protein
MNSMNVKQIYQLQQGDKVTHQTYGVCTVDGVIRSYGPLLKPDTMAGRDLLSQASRTPSGTPVVETAFHLLTSLTMVPAISSSDAPNPFTGTLPGY